MRLLALLAFAAGLAAEPAFIGADACKSCHPSQFEKQSASAHALALRATSAHPLAAGFQSKLDFAPQWAFGAGQQAVTFVSRLAAGAYLEHHLSYYRKPAAMAPTPGHAGLPEPGVLYPTFAADAAILRCFQCHSTGPIQLGDDNRLQPSEVGVRCESCHGPAGDHARAPAQTNILNPARYTPTELNTLCGSCHRKPSVRGVATDWTDPWNTRHQPLYLAQSKCFRSSGTLSCLTCHDAHTGTAQASCGGCHPRPRHSRTLNLAAGCVSCHMPAVTPQPHLTFANHWIGVYRPGAPLRPVRR